MSQTVWLFINKIQDPEYQVFKTKSKAFQVIWKYLEENDSVLFDSLKETMTEEGIEIVTNVYDERAFDILHEWMEVEDNYQLFEVSCF